MMNPTLLSIGVSYVMTRSMRQHIVLLRHYFACCLHDFSCSNSVFPFLVCSIKSPLFATKYILLNTHHDSGEAFVCPTHIPPRCSLVNGYVSLGRIAYVTQRRYNSQHNTLEGTLNSLLYTNDSAASIFLVIRQGRDETNECTPV
jgi:hypothetical protein